MLNDLTRPRGRPTLPRDENGKCIHRPAMAKKPRWNPKKWHPVYEEIVLLDILGYKQYEIAAQKSFSVPHINNILCSEPAKIIKTMVSARIEQSTLKSIESKLDECVKLSVDRMKEVLTSDEYALKSPKGMFDCAISALKFMGKSKDQTNAQQVQNNNLIITEHQFDTLIKGMKVADEAKKLHLLPAKTA